MPATEVDGIFEYRFGQESPTAVYMQRALGIANLGGFADIQGTGPSGVAAANVGVMAVASGVCEAVLVYRSMTRAAGHTGNIVHAPREIAGTDQFTSVYGYAGGILSNIAMKKRRRIAELGGSEEDYGSIAVNARKWSSRNERAVLRDLITMDDYLSSRMVVDPLVLLDCDYPVNGSCAVLITTTERARDLRQTPVHVDSVAWGTGVKADWVFPQDFLFGGTVGCAKHLWSRSALCPDDIDVIELYDGFTHITISWIEALGFCGTGEFGEWVDGGRTIGPGGHLPLNTSGGQLAEGRLHGLGLLNEAVLQLRGQCGDRQVRDSRASVVANGHGPQCGAMVLHV
jgi:acetyl-CoA acetyltransferase